MQLQFFDARSSAGRPNTKQDLFLPVNRSKNRLGNTASSPASRTKQKREAFASRFCLVQLYLPMGNTISLPHRGNIAFAKQKYRSGKAGISLKPLCFQQKRKHRGIFLFSFRHLHLFATIPTHFRRPGGWQGEAECSNWGISYFCFSFRYARGAMLCFCLKTMLKVREEEKPDSSATWLQLFLVFTKRYSAFANLKLLMYWGKLIPMILLKV